MKSYRIYISIPLLLFSFSILASSPGVDNLIVATYQGGPVSITGSGFGTPGPDRHLLVTSGSYSQTLASTHSVIKVWTDTKILLNLPAGAASGRLQIITPDGISDQIEVTVYEYDWFDIPETPGTNAHPLSIDVDPTGKVWVNQEFHLEFQMLDPALGVVEGIPIPRPPDPGPFAMDLFSDHRSQISGFGEDVMVDPLGRIWFTQGGRNLYSGVHPNHSRIVCIIPTVDSLQYRVYNVPGDNNHVTGITWDHTRNWIWFAQSSLPEHAKIYGFDPELVPWENEFAFDTSLDHQICSTTSGPDCYHTYVLEDSFSSPAHLLVTDDGKIWYTAYWGRFLGRLDPTTGLQNKYPVPAPISTTFAGAVVGPGPWEILEAPNGDIIFNEFFDATITRFDITMADDPAATALDPSGANPAMFDHVIPQYNPAKENVHSIAYDTLGNLWYTIHTHVDNLNSRASLGYISPDWASITRIPPLGKFPGVGAPTADGIIVDKTSGDIWFCEYYRKRIGRLRKRQELP